MPRKLVRKGSPEPEPGGGGGEGGDDNGGAVTDGWRPEPLLYNVEQACILLGGISKQMLYRLINLDQIHPKKIGTRSMFTMEELERYVSTL